MSHRYHSPTSPYFNMPMTEIIDVKRARRMAEVDSYDPAIRALVHEYGLNVVKNFLDAGVTKPRRIKHLVEVVLNEFSPTRGSYSIQGWRVNVDDEVKKNV